MVNIKKILGLMVIVFMAAGCGFKAQPPASNNSSNNNASSSPTSNNHSAPAAPMAQTTYTNSQYNFSFAYPNSFKQVAPVYGNLGNQIIQVQLDNTNYPKTNFADADFTVSQQPAANISECLKYGYPQSPASGGTQQKQISGINYYLTQGGGAGAGNFYNFEIYRTFNRGNCFEMNETIHTTNIDNYTPGTVTQIDIGPIQAQLDQILSSFVFIK
jgi:hypothetical protein